LLDTAHGDAPDPVPVPVAARGPAPAPGSAGRFAPLDGIRALAVTAVILFHASPSWAIGGYFGVDVFFVLSGYLITSLLLGEWRRTGRVALPASGGRRARRLLPALFLMLAVVGAVAVLFPRVLGSPDLFSDTAATLGYVANWHFIAAHANYFATVSNPSPLQHTWTLAIEEQFYLAWPLVVLAVMWLVNRGGRRRVQSGLNSLVVIAVVGAGASAILMSALAPVGAASVNRAYYGSDTRAQGLLVGCALAALCAGRGPLRSAAGRWAIGALGLAGAVGALVMWRTVAESSAFAFHGGFALIAVCTAAVIACVTLLPHHPLARILARQPLPYLGRISYGMYLWYWPVLLVVTTGRTHLHGVTLLACRLLVIVGVASASYYLVEAPIQRGALTRWRTWAAAPVAAVAAVGVALVPLLAPVATEGTATALTAKATATATAKAAATAGFRGSTPLEPLKAAAAARPVRILLLGDSVAGSLGVGLAAIAPRYGAQVINQGDPGCSLASADQVKVLFYTDPPGQPCQPGNPGHLLQVYQGLVAQYDPDVVIYVARSDTLTTYLDGSWQYLGMPSFDRWTASRFGAAVPVLSSRGAHVVFLTSPFYDSGEGPDGTGWPENTPSRVGTDNSLMTQVAGRFPNVASVIDLGQLLSPGGHYAAKVDGLPVRCGDGVHLTPLGGVWVGTHILPQILALGRTHAAAPAAATRPPAPPFSVPAWYPELPCRS
jgi:peptidoglycan/LPS O-acetylase OafA/YrhL